MTIVRRLSAVAFAAGVIAMGLAPQAAAIAPPPDGYFTYNQEGAPAAKWQLQSVCMQANGTRAQPDYTDETIQTLGCVLIVTSSTPSTLTREERVVNFSTRALLTSDLWTFKIESTEGIACPDGSTAPSTETFAFDGATLAGTHTTLHGDVCGMSAGMVKTPFTLSFLGPLQPPMENRFPDNCNYLAGRPSICS